MPVRGGEQLRLRMDLPLRTCKAHGLPKRESFTIQVSTPDLALEMVFADAD